MSDGFDATYVIVVCEGSRCVPVLAPEAAGRAGPAEALIILVALADRLRGQRAMGRLRLLDGRTGAMVAERPLWP